MIFAAIKWTLYALQLVDVLISSGFHNGVETNPLARPFSHGGVPMYIVGTALGDYALDTATRHWSPGAQKTVQTFQTFAEGYAVGSMIVEEHKQ